MGIRYYKLTDDIAHPNRWELGKLHDARGEELWPAPLMRGEPIHLGGRMTLPVKRMGTALDFSHAAFGIPIVHVRIAECFMHLATDCVQLFPVDIEGHAEQYVLLNVTRTVKCIDDHASEEVRYWRPEDERPEKTGQYRAVYGMRLDPAKIGDAKLFRPWGWTVALIVSEEVKQALEDLKATGVNFKEV